MTIHTGGLVAAKDTGNLSRLVLRSFSTIELSNLRNRIQDLQRKSAKLQATSRINSPHLGQDQKLHDSTAVLIGDANSTLNYATSIYEDSVSTRSATRISRVGAVSDPARMNAPSLPMTTSQSTIGKGVHPSYQESIASTSVVSLPIIPRKPAVEGSVSTTIADIEEKSVEAGSHLGVPTPPVNIDNVSQWIHGLSELDKRHRSSTMLSRISQPSTITRPSSTVTSDVVSGRSIGECLMSDTTALTEPSGVRSIPDAATSDTMRENKSAAVDDSDDDDIGLELAKNVLTMGESALDKEDYSGARACLVEGLNLVQQLPSKLQARACDMLDLRYQLATCALALDNQLAVEKALVETLQQQPASDAQREKLFHVSHILSQLYVRTARLDLARQSCNNALQGRRKLCGKESEGYYVSLALMARICELQGAPVQAQGYMRMIPVPERNNHSFHHLRMEEYSQKEVVVAGQPGPSTQHISPIVPGSSPVVNTPDAGFQIFVPHSPALDVSSPTSSRSVAPVEVQNAALTSERPAAERNSSYVVVAEPPPYQEPVASQEMLQPLSQPVPQSATQPPPQPLVRSGESVRSVRSTRTSNTDSFTAAAPVPLPATLAQRGSEAVMASPANDYLGFCKGAWLLQSGDQKAMKKTKDFDFGRSSSPIYSLTCSASKCQFATEIELSVIGTWSKVWRAKEKIGIAYRWAFLAKSHVRQSAKVSAHQQMYKCMFCTSLGLNAPTMQGTDLYFDHIAQEHRGSALSPVVLFRARCIDDRICTDKDEFDINLYPRT
jgi:hypothetical protein